MNKKYLIIICITLFGFNSHYSWSMEEEEIQIEEDEGTSCRAIIVDTPQLQLKRQDWYRQQFPKYSEELNEILKKLQNTEALLKILKKRDGSRILYPKEFYAVYFIQHFTESFAVALAEILALQQLPEFAVKGLTHIIKRFNKIHILKTALQERKLQESYEKNIEDEQTLQLNEALLLQAYAHLSTINSPLT